MPVMGGELAFEKLRKIQPDVQLILSSGYSENESTSRFHGKGLAGFTQKPYAVETLRQKPLDVLGD